MRKKFCKLPENTEKKQKKGKFQKGHSGNPKGRPLGARNKATLIAEELLEGDIEGVCRRLIKEALSGNVQAIKLVLERVLPPKKGSIVSLRIPRVKSSSDPLKVMSAVFDAISNQEISLMEARELSGVVEVYMKSLEVYEFNRRLTELERKANNERDK